MQKGGIVLIIFGIIVIAFPAIIAYLIGGLLVFLGLNIFLLTSGKKSFWKKKPSMEDFVKFGDYKIFRGKK